MSRLSTLTVMFIEATMEIQDDTLWYFMSSVIFSNFIVDDDLWKGFFHLKLAKRCQYLDLTIYHLQQAVRIFEEDAEMEKKLKRTEAEVPMNAPKEEFVRIAKALLEKCEDEMKTRNEEAAGLGRLILVYLHLGMIVDKVLVWTED